MLLIESRVAGDGSGIFAGIDTTLVGLAATLPADAAAATRTHLEAYREAVGRAVEGFGLDPSVIAGDLGEALLHLDRASETAGSFAGTEFRLAIRQKTEIATDALMAATGIAFDVRSDDDLLVPGQTARVRAQLWNGGALSLSLPEVELDSAFDWEITEVSVQGLDDDGRVAPGSLVTWTYDVRLPADAEPSRLYYLREAREGALYRWPDQPELWGLPRDPAPIAGSATFTPFAGGEPLAGRLTTSRPWRYVGVHPARGEFVRPVLIVPAVSVRVVPGGLVWPEERAEARSVSVVIQ